MCPAGKARLLAAGGAHRAPTPLTAVCLAARAIAAAGVEGGLRTPCGAAGGDGDSVRRVLGTGLAPEAPRESC